MIDYNFQGRLTYLPGGPLNVQMSAWPVGGKWWEPTTGSYTCVAAYQAIGAASLSASYVNLADPGTYDAAPGDAPTFDTAMGWQFNGTSDYLLTGYAPGATRNTTIIIRGYCTADIYDPVVLAGCANGDGTGRLRLPGRAHPYVAFYHGDTAGAWITELLNAWSIGALAGSNGYYDGSLVVSGIPAGTGDVPNIAIGAERYGTGPGSFFKGYIAAVAIYSTTLDATQVAEVSAAMAAL